MTLVATAIVPLALKPGDDAAQKVGGCWRLGCLQASVMLLTKWGGLERDCRGTVNWVCNTPAPETANRQNQIFNAKEKAPLNKKGAAPKGKAKR